MHKAKTSKLLISVLAVFSLVFGGVIGLVTPANAAVCGGAMPTVSLVSDPIMYAGGVYNANYIGYKITGGTTPSTNLTVKLEGLGGSDRIQLASSQADTQTVGSLATSASKYVFFLASIGTAATTAESHDVVLTDGVSTCTDTTTINPATSVSPAATSNNSNKVDSVTIGTAPSSVGGTITVTVKGETGQVGTNEGISFAPVSNASFPANKWKLISSSIELNQNSTWTTSSGTDTFTDRLYLPYLAPVGINYSGANLGAIDGKYTAVYTFELIAATGAATEMKPIQYVGNVYTGSMPAGSAPTISATGAAAAVPTIAPSNQSVSGTTNTAITSTSTFTPSNFSAGTLAYTISPSLPAGLSISSSTGVISGTPTATSSSTTYTITATNAATDPDETATSSVTISVVAPGTPTITPGSLSVSGTTGTAIASTSAFTKTNFTCTPVFSATLPAGLSINSSTGVISGTPTATSSSTVTVTATCSSETATSSVTFSISAPVVTQAPVLDRKVTICHRTHSVTNPYVRITVDYNSVNKKSGHQIHDEIFAGQHVFKAGIYVRAKDKDWGDIIPADPTGFNRWQPLNWTTLGAQIYNGTVDGCPAYDAVKYYNALREAGVPEKKIKAEIAELDTEQAEAKPEAKKTNITELKYTGVDSKVAEEDGDKVTICHRTNSVTNPYVRITVAAASIYKNAGHYGHDEIYSGHHVFDSTVAYPNNKKDWGDIIPADPTGKNRWAALNMTTLGAKIYSGEVEGCAEKSMQTLYNELREEGKSKKEIVKDLEAQKNIDEDPKDLDELEYTGDDPVVEKSEPKEPTDPYADNDSDGTDGTDGNDDTPNNAVKIPDQSLSGIVWLDINKDGLKDPDEPLMKNIKLYVVQVSSIPAPVTPASILASPSMLRANVKAADAPVRAAAVVEVLTDANGFYLFPSLGAGDWRVTTSIPDDLYVTYDSHESSDGSITTTVPVASHAFTWVGLVGDDEEVTLEKLTEILKENPNALPLAEVPPALQKMVVQARAAVKAAEAAASKPTTPTKTAANGTALAETGTSDLAWLYFGILLMLTGVALRLARTKR